MQDRVEISDRVVVKIKNYIGDYHIHQISKFGELEDFYSDINSSDYLIISERIEVFYLPELNFLLDPTNETIPEYLEDILFIINSIEK